MLTLTAVISTASQQPESNSMAQKRRNAKTLEAIAPTALSLWAAFLFFPAALQADEIDQDLVDRFEHLSVSGNSNCSTEFAQAISAMPQVALLQGSCCSPMELHRYAEQIRGLEKYSAISQIPNDPYNIPAGTAQALMAHYSIELSPIEQAAYDYAMAHSDEQGPCCCECWRWEVYGGLAKFLISEHRFSGPQIAELWDISDGCGGGEKHDHG